MLEQTAQQILLAIMAGIAVFFVQAAVYRSFYKRKVWRSHLFEVVLKKIRRWVYLTMILLSAKVATTLMPESALHFKPGDVIVTWALIGMGGVLAIEASAALVFDYFLRDVRQVEIPNLYRDITRFMLYIFLFCMLFYQLGYDVRALVTGGTVITLVIGFATQESLGNVFAGIFLHSSRPFTRGDWVRFGDKEGEVEKIDWRATTIRTNNGDFIVFPNAMIAKMELTNFSAPSKLHAHLMHVGVHYKHSPSKVKRILSDCALKTAKVQHQPMPVARIRAYDDSSIRYELKVWITDYEDLLNIQGHIYDNIWYHFKREDIEIPFPIRTVQIHRPEKVDTESINYKLLKRIDFLSELPESDMKYLASRLKVVTYTANEPVIKQGEPGRSFYIVREGRAEVQVRDAEGKMVFSKELGPGQFFGEFSLLTGEPRTATVVTLEESELLRLDKEAFRKIVEENPKADELISTVLARRQELSAKKKEAKDAEASNNGESDSTSSTRALFVKKIRDFFSY